MSSLTKLELTQVSLRLDSCFVEQSKTTGCASSSSSLSSAMRSASISLCERKRFKYAGRKNVRSIRHVSSQASSGFSARDALFDERQLRETRTEIYACSRANFARRSHRLRLCEFLGVIDVLYFLFSNCTRCVIYLNQGGTCASRWI